MQNQPQNWKRATLIVLFMIAYVAWVAFYVLNLRPLVLMWCYKNLGLTAFPIWGHVILIFSPALVPMIVYTTVKKFIHNVKGTIQGRSYSD